MLPTKVKVKRDKTPEQALTSLMRLCARAEKSSGDALRLMHTWGVDQNRRREVLDKLITMRFIDDSRFAEAFVRDKIGLSGWGRYKIEAALQRKGIARDTIAHALAQLDDTDMQSRLAQQLTRKARTTKSSSPYELRTKLIRYGLSLGYEYDTVIDAVDREGAVDNEE